MSATATATTPGHPAAPRPSTTASRRAAHALLGVVAWIVGILFVLPVLWMVLTSFHSEDDAAKNPPDALRAADAGGYQVVLRRRARGRRC